MGDDLKRKIKAHRKHLNISEWAEVVTWEGLALCYHLFTQSSVNLHINSFSSPAVNLTQTHHVAPRMTLAYAKC